MSETTAQTLQRRAELATWGCLACAQPWMAAGSLWCLFWVALTVAAWLVEREAEKAIRKGSA